MSALSFTDRLRGAVSRPVAAESVADRVEALHRFLRATENHLPEQRLTGTRAVVERAGERLRLSGEHSVVALAGATGSGKSSLFNGLAGLHLSRVGVRRPTTGAAHACVWGTDRAGALLDWLGVPPSRRFTRESALDGGDEQKLRGLVLLDLPDFDSVEQSHRVEVDRLLSLVDVMVWVLDPQKYADHVVHERYLARFTRHRDITVVVLNQADRLGPADTERCLDDLQRLLNADGLAGVAVIATSAVDRPGLRPLRELLEATVTARRAMLRRLSADVEALVADLAPLVGPEAAEDDVDRAAVRDLTRTLAIAAGVPLVAATTRLAYRHRAIASMGWPLSRWLRRLRPDPLRRLGLGGPSAAGAGPDQQGGGAGPVAASSVPVAAATESAAVGLALRTLGNQAGAELPDLWRAAILSAARSRAHDLADALDVAIARTDLGVSRRPLWWRLVGTLQWLATVAALGGLAWLTVRYAVFAIGLPEIPGPHVGRVPVATALLAGGLLTGLLISVAVRPLIVFAARRAEARAGNRLRAAVREVGLDLCVTPVREVLHAYADARSALRAAEGR